MNITIQIPDETVSKMLTTGNREQGTISMANATEGNFHPHRRTPQLYQPDRKVIMLRCGKAVVTNEKLFLRLQVNRTCVDMPEDIIVKDCKEAEEFYLSLPPKR